MRGGLLRRKPGEALSHLQNKCINIFDKDRKMIEFFHEPCYTGTTFRPNHRIGEEGFMDKKHSKTSVYKGYKQDKIEMRGDRAEMSDFPLYLNTVAGGLDRRDQTIGGFSFVVKIYAVPVVEIIG